MTKYFTLREWTIAAAIGFGIGGEVLLWLLMGGAPSHGLLLSLPVILAYAAAGAFTWWYLLKRDFEFSVWRGITIGLIIGLLAPSIFWLIGSLFYFIAGRVLPVFDRVVNPLEALWLLPTRHFGSMGIARLGFGCDERLCQRLVSLFQSALLA